jgi:ABC-type Zn2+ transport system substrate-binding protein/surface adhesin
MAQSNKPTLLESLRNLAVEAIQDIRHKAVEEPWFGRETTKDAAAPMNMRHNHEHDHQHKHTHSYTHSHTHTHDHQHTHSHSHDHQHHRLESPYVKDGLPATFDEYLAKHQGMGQELQPERGQEREAEITQDQSQQREIERE